MPEIVVAAQGRTSKGKNENRRLRAQGLIPGVLYGNRQSPVHLALSPRDLATVLKSASGTNTLFDLQLEGKSRKVILKEYQVEPLKGRMLHADLYEVALDQTLELQVNVELTGVPVGVKVQGGVLDFVTRTLEIEVLPLDIPDKITVDVSHLEIGKHFRVSDLKLSDKVKILTEPEVVIAHVVTMRAEEVTTAAVEAAPAEGAAAAEPEVIKKGKTEEAAAEGGEKEKKAEKKEKK